MKLVTVQKVVICVRERYTYTSKAGIVGSFFLDDFQLVQQVGVVFLDLTLTL